MVFQEVAPAQARKVRNRRDLEGELFGASDISSVISGSDVSVIRDNEGEAAEHGVYYDDTEYDYMQHMRDLGGESNTEASSIWMSASQGKEKHKQKQSLSDALAALDLDHEKVQAEKKGKLVDPAILPASGVRKTTYQNQQDLPDELAGFQPDMDPRLREILEALEDEAYIDADEDGDFFGTIAEGGKEISLEEFEDGLYEDQEGDWLDEEEEGWASDRTVKANEDNVRVPQLVSGPAVSSVTQPASTATAATEDGDFMSSFRNLPQAIKKPISNTRFNANGAGSLYSAAQSSLLSGMKHKKRKGAKTSLSSFSMTSSSIARTEGLQTLDARFDQILENYAEDDADGEFDDGMSMASGMTGISKVSGISRASQLSGVSNLSTASRRSAMSELVNRKEFDSVMDEFLGGHEIKGRRRVRKGNGKTGMEELDEIRNTLGRGERMAGSIAGASVAS